MKTAIIAGCTGLIGSQVLSLLLQNDSYNRVIALSRRPLSQRHDKLHNLIVDFTQLSNHATELAGDDVYCCLGTTMKQAGTREEFRRVDLDFPVSLATVTREKGARQFLLVTAGGANKNSIIFYSRVKGEVEELITGIKFESLHIFRPALLLGERPQKRPGEGVGAAVMTALGFLIPGNYKAIEGSRVARAMVALATQNLSGTFIHTSAELQSY